MAFDWQTSDTIKARIGDWLEPTPELREKFDGQFPTALAWTLTCSPETSTDRLALAVMDLHLWFLHLDDYPGQDFADFYSSVGGALERGVRAARPDDGQQERDPLLWAFAQHTLRIAALGLPMERYASERQAALETYVMRNRAKLTTQVSFEEFLRIRKVTTLFRLWFSLWEILGGFSLTEDEYSTGPFAAAIDTVIEFHVFLNELHSLDRDMAEGMPNLIACLQQEQDLDRTAASLHVTRICDECEARFGRQWDDCRALGSDIGHMHQAFAFLELTLSGGRQLYRSDLERYQPAIDELA